VRRGRARRRGEKVSRTASSAPFEAPAPEAGTSWSHTRMSMTLPVRQPRVLAKRSGSRPTRLWRRDRPGRASPGAGKRSLSLRSAKPSPQRPGDDIAGDGTRTLRTGDQGSPSAPRRDGRTRTGGTQPALSYSTGVTDEGHASSRPQLRRLRPERRWPGRVR
jgi:hypothetical protein